MDKRCSAYFNSEFWNCDRLKETTRKKESHLEKKQFQMRHQMRDQIVKEGKLIEEKLPNDFNKLLELIMTEVLTKKPINILTFISNLLDLLLECRNREEKEFYEMNRLSERKIQEVKEDDGPLKYRVEEDDHEEDKEDEMQDIVETYEAESPIMEADDAETDIENLTEQEEAEATLYGLRDEEEECKGGSYEADISYSPREQEEAEDSLYELQDEEEDCKGGSYEADISYSAKGEGEVVNEGMLEEVEERYEEGGMVGKVVEPNEEIYEEEVEEEEEEIKDEAEEEEETEAEEAEEEEEIEAEEEEDEEEQEAEIKDELFEKERDEVEKRDEAMEKQDEEKEDAVEKVDEVEEDHYEDHYEDDFEEENVVEDDDAREATSPSQAESYAGNKSSEMKAAPVKGSAVEGDITRQDEEEGGGTEPEGEVEEKNEVESGLKLEIGIDHEEDEEQTQANEAEVSKVEDVVKELEDDLRTEDTDSV